jgi:hypothetical protein
LDLLDVYGFEAVSIRMKVFRHIGFDGKRDYECTNVIACIAETAPDEHWIENTDPQFPVSAFPDGRAALTQHVQQLYTKAGVRYFGWL